jgi:hypothetical protein
MDKRGINPENPIPRTSTNYDSFIRKTKEIVINRLVFAKYKDQPSNDDLTSRSRKEYPIYYGKETIFKICEGNPRFIMNIIDELIIKTQKYKDIERDLKFSPTEQVEVIKRISIRFNAMIKSYPTNTYYNNKNVNLSWLINQIGSYFENELNYKDFSLNPPTCFTYNDKKTNPDIIDLIKKGVELGAFIKLDENMDEIGHDNENSRYRLTYLLHPSFKLPLRLYSSASLNNIIKYDNQTNIRFKK